MSYTKDDEKLMSLGRMTRGLIHDFNNSLASIQGYAEFLVSDLEAGSEQFVFAENIQKSALQMKGLLQQIRSYSQDEKQSEEQIDVLSTLNDVVTDFFSNLPSSYTLNFKADNLQVGMDISYVQFATLIRSLLANAVESIHGDRGVVSVTLSGNPPMIDHSLESWSSSRDILSPDQPTSDYCYIAIEDTGCGMNDVILGLAFEPYFTTKSAESSHGMGLPIVYGIVHHLDGGLHIETTPNKGTRITLTLPVAHISVTRKSDNFSPKNILLVEDRSMVRHTLSTMLTREGHRVIECDNPLIALDTLRENAGHFDAVMTDFSMPHMDGIEFLKELREDFPNLPVIIMSGDEEKLRRALRSFEDKHAYCLSKPVLSSSLKTLLPKI